MSKHYITLPNGRAVGLATYTNAWRILKTVPANLECLGWDYVPVRADVIFTAIRRGVNDRINIRGGVIIPDSIHSATRTRRRLAAKVAAGHLRCECRWCGSPMPYADRERRFCEPSCRHSYFN